MGTEPRRGRAERAIERVERHGARTSCVRAASSDGSSFGKRFFTVLRIPTKTVT
jgi:hypothetical protein